MGFTTLFILVIFKIIGKKFPDKVIFSFGPVFCIISATIINWLFLLT